MTAQDTWTRFFSFFFFNDTATTEIYTLSLHDALPILHARHRKVKRKENLGVPGIDFCFGMARHGFVETKRRSGHMMFYKFLAPFITLDAKKSEAKQQSQNQQNDDLLLFAQLRGAHRKGHGQAAANQNR